MLTSEELLLSPMLKLARARHHISDLEAKSEAFFARKPFVLWERHMRKAGRKTFFVKKSESIPPEFSLIIGDAYHNLRSALDHTVFKMAVDRAPKASLIQFPFAADDTPQALKRAMERAQVEFAGKKVFEQICALNPSPGGNGDLYFIHLADIQDKHRLLVLADARAAIHAGSPGEAILRPVLAEPMVAGTQVILSGPEDADLMSFDGIPYVLRNLPDSENEAKVQPTFTVVLAESGLANYPIIESLLISEREVNFTVKKLVEAYLDPGNTFPS